MPFWKGLLNSDSLESSSGKIITEWDLKAAAGWHTEKVVLAYD